ncbi:enoyl-CoA hydratase/isomerase family protein [Xanthobacter versatilis]|uniref:enoyl-CoA hydratase/isomerase family protein n=1 Tax=Xanthobacter autotrophicus (strain ATCC BAA-1158 / Py2) TaxID=78245 RepID=UPI00372915FC
MDEVQYPPYSGLKLDWPLDGVLRVTISHGAMNSMDYELHHDLGSIWRLIDADPQARVVIVTGEGRAFSAGGDFEMVDRIIKDHTFRMQMWKDGRQLVDNILNCSKPIISAINGAAAGGGLAVALLADISIAARSAKLVDGHTTIGVAADDHAVAIWPLLVGMAKSKYHLMTNAPVTGEEAERMGLVSLCVEDDKVMERALEVAAKLAAGAPEALRFTKIALNNWLKAAWPAFEASLAFGILGFAGPEAGEGLQALREKRAPNFPKKSYV